MKAGQLKNKREMVEKDKEEQKKGRRSYRSSVLMMVLLFIVLLLSSCAYYNTFYNAKKYFESAQSQPLRDTGRPSPRAIQDYDKVIQRCTYILTEYRDSRWADDALFLLARSMYYKQQNIRQARERFIDLTNIFPDSNFVPHAHIYIAKIDFELNDRNEAHRRLQVILENPDHEELHPEVCLLKSNFHLEEDEYTLAQSYLQMIIDNYPRTQQFELAFFTLGKTHLANENYQESKEVFEILLNSRASRRTKLNSRYYVARNYFHLGEYNEALVILDELIRAEYEQTELPKLNLLKARTLEGLGDYREAEALYKLVLENNQRTAISAETSYHLAEMYFLKLLDYEQAIVYYNRITAELRSSPFVEKGMARSAVVSQIIQFSDTERNISITDLVEEQFKLAEHYLYVLNMPDSSLSVYSDLKKQEERLSNKLNNLRAKQLNPESDDNIEIKEEFVDLDEEEMAELSGEGSTQASSLTTTLENDMREMEEDLQLFQEEFVPYSYFASAWIWYHIKNGQEKAEEILLKLQTEYPDNKYTYAAESMLTGEEIRFVTPFEKEIAQRYEIAINRVEEDPEETISLLQNIIKETTPLVSDSTRRISDQIKDIHYRTLYSIGFTYYFHLADSVNARSYFDMVLTEQENSEFSQFIRNFYQDDVFIVHDTLPIMEVSQEEEKIAEESKDETQEESGFEGEPMMPGEFKPFDEYDFKIPDRKGL